MQPYAPASTPTPPTPPPTPADSAQDVLPLPADGHGSRAYWKREIDAATEKVKALKDSEWDNNILSYRAKNLAAIQDNGVGNVVVPRDFPMVEQKAAQLFFQTPDIHLKSTLPALADPVTLWQPVVNHYLSEDECNALAMMNECIFDALCPSGLLCSKLGFEVFVQGIQDIETGAMQDDPAFDPAAAEGRMPEGPLSGILALLGGGGGAGDTTNPGSLAGNTLGLGTPAPLTPQIPVTRPTPHIVHSRFFWERFSPATVVIPTGFSGSVYDKANYLGNRFEEDWEVLRKRYSLPDDMDIPKSRVGTDTQDLKLKGENAPPATRSATSKVRGTEIWYRCAYYLPDEAHPELIYQLVLLDGVDAPLIHRMSPYQKYNSKGRLIGMMGFPIHIGALRYVSDTAFPPSECSISRATNEELNKGRTYMMLQRDRSTPMRYGNLSVLGQPGFDKIAANVFQSIIPLARYDAANPPIGVIALAQFPRENFTFNDYLDRDYEQVWSMGANQRGQESEKSLTATEITKIDQWANTRLDKERRQALAYFIRGTRKFGALLQMFLTEEEIAAVIGEQDMPRMAPFVRTEIANAFAYTANPDSAIRIDQTQARTQILKLYELLAKDPNFKRTELLVEVCRAWNLDPTKFIVTELPNKPAPIALSVRFDSEQLDVRNPNFPIYLAIMKANGYESLEQPVQDPTTGETEPSPVEQALAYSQLQGQLGNMAAGVSGADPSSAFPPPEPGGGPADGDHEAYPAGPGAAYPAEHGGTAPKADRINKHQGDETGDRSGPKPQLVKR